MNEQGGHFQSLADSSCDPAAWGVFMQWSWTGTLREVQALRPQTWEMADNKLPGAVLLSSHSSQIDVSNDFWSHF